MPLCLLQTVNYWINLSRLYKLSGIYYWLLKPSRLILSNSVLFSVLEYIMTARAQLYLICDVRQKKEKNAPRRFFRAAWFSKTPARYSFAVGVIEKEKAILFNSIIK